MSRITQSELILSYFKTHPNRDIPHREVVDWSVAEYKRLTGEVLRDPDRAVRKLHQAGYLIKVAVGVYRYDPAHVNRVNVPDFTWNVKQEIFLRDGYRCIVCGRGKPDGMEIHADHVKPRDKGGPSTVENGQTLCSQHNFQKKNYDAHEFGKKLFQNWRERAIEVDDETMQSFCEEVLELFDAYRIG